MRPRTNRVFAIPSEEFVKVCGESTSLAQVMRAFGLGVDAGWTYRNVKMRVAELGIDLSHILLGKGANKGRKFRGSAVPIEQLLVEKSTAHRCDLKRRLLKLGLLKLQCQGCGITTIWNNKELKLQLDHINGVNNDNRIENLRLLCPNCHSQTDTFGGRNKKEKTPKPKGDRNRPRPNQRKVKERPDRDTLLALVKENGYLATGRMFGVSDTAIRKWLKTIGD